MIPPLFAIEWFVVGSKNGEQRERTRDTAAASFVAIDAWAWAVAVFRPYRFSVCPQMFPSIAA